MPTASATVTVARTDKSDIGHREIFVSLDNQRIAILKHGDVVTRDLAPGHHTLKAHNTLFWKTVELDLQPGEQARFTVINRAGWGTYSVLGWIGAGPLYLTLERAA